MSKKSICPKCGKPFSMGDNGTVDGCDGCTGVQRDRNGYAWFPDETEQVYLDENTGELLAVTREEAFGK